MMATTLLQTSAILTNAIPLITTTAAAATDNRFDQKMEIFESVLVVNFL
jgi:hypothetical protein